jgi:hypothetical protein
MIAHLPRAPRRHPTQRLESCGSTEPLRLLCPSGHSTLGGIAAPSPLSGPSRRYSLPLVRLVRHVQWFASSQNDGATSSKPRAHKVRGGCGRIRTLHPSSPLIGLCISMHVPMVRMSGGLPYVRLVSPTCIVISPDDTRESPLVICHLQPPRSSLHTSQETPEVETFGSCKTGMPGCHRYCRPRRPGVSPPSGTCRLHLGVRACPPLRRPRNLHF